MALGHLRSVGFLGAPGIPQMLLAGRERRFLADSLPGIAPSMVWGDHRTSSISGRRRTWSALSRTTGGTSG